MVMLIFYLYKYKYLNINKEKYASKTYDVKSEAKCKSKTPGEHCEYKGEWVDKRVRESLFKR